MYKDRPEATLKSSMNTCEPCPPNEWVQPSVLDNLIAERDCLEKRLKGINEAILLVQSNPELQESFRKLSQLGAY